MSMSRSGKRMLIAILILIVMAVGLRYGAQGLRRLGPMIHGTPSGR
jgi:hypothetical protein